MDEIELLRDFRSNVTTDTDAAKRRARGLLAERMSIRSRDRRRRWLLRGGLPASVCAVVLTLAIALNPFPGTQTGSSAAAAEFRAMANTASLPTTPSMTLDDGQFAYSRAETRWATTTDTRDGRAATALIPGVQEMWIAADGSGRIRETVTGDMVWLTKPDAEMGDMFLRFGGSDWTFGPGELTQNDELLGLTQERMAELSANPDALEEIIHARAEQSDNPLDYESFVIVGELLHGSNLSRDFRAAIFQFAASIPDVDLLGEVIDSAGRPGIAVAMDHHGIRHEIIIDPQAAQLLEERDILISSGADYEYVVTPGTIVGLATYNLVTGIVSSTTETP